MVLRFLIFITVFVGIIFGSHVIVYISAIKFLNITSATVKIYLAVILAFLSISFFLSALLVRIHSNIITNSLYSLSAFWLGLLNNLIIAIVIMWAVYGITQFFKNPPELFYVTLSMIGFTIVISVVGVLNAINPLIKTIEVPVKNLPDSWKGKSIVQLSDLHLGDLNREDFLKKVIKKTESLNPEIILITGDLFDGGAQKLERFTESLKTLNAKKGVYFITGNHEEYLGLDKPLKVVKDSGIINIDNKIIDIDGLQIIGIGHPLTGSSNKAKEVFGSADFNPEKPTILMYHTPTDITRVNRSASEQQWRAYWQPLTNFDFVKEKKVDLQLSGHTHAGQIFPFNLIAKIIFNGYSHGLNRDGDFYIYTSSGVGTWGPPMRTCAVPEIVEIKLK